MSEIWLTSDWHVSHEAIIRMCRRPFHSVENMNKLLIENFNERVTNDDTVYMLGDFAMGQIAESLPLAQQLNGKVKYIIPGNHDRIHPMHKKAAEWVQRYEDAGFTILPSQIRVPVNGLGEVLLCHFPPTGDSHDEDRFKEWRPVDDGQTIVLHGHCHSNQPRYGDRSFDVGVDANGYYPRTITEILNAEA